MKKSTLTVLVVIGIIVLIVADAQRDRKSVV